MCCKLEHHWQDIDKISSKIVGGANFIIHRTEKNLHNIQYYIYTNPYTVYMTKSLLVKLLFYWEIRKRLKKIIKEILMSTMTHFICPDNKLTLKQYEFLQLHIIRHIYIVQMVCIYIYILCVYNIRYHIKQVYIFVNLSFC